MISKWGLVVVLTSLCLGARLARRLPAFDQETSTNKAKLLSFRLAIPVKSANDFGQILIGDAYTHKTCRFMQSPRLPQAVCMASRTRLLRIEEESTHYEDAFTTSGPCAANDIHEVVQRRHRFLIVAPKEVRLGYARQSWNR